MNYFNLILKTLHDFGVTFAAHIPHMIIAVLFLVFTHYIAKLASHLLGISLSRWMRTSLVMVFQKFTVIFIWFIGILIVAAIVFPSVTPANLLATFGLTSVAIGFAFKDIFENFFAGILILLREPFHVGDYIHTKDEQGYVEYISVRNTHIRQTDGVRVVIPNALLFNNPTRVLTDLDYRRINFQLCVDFGQDLEKIRELILATIKSCESVNKEKYIQVNVDSYSSNGLGLNLYWWAKSRPSDMQFSRNEVLSKIYQVLGKAEIRLNYSTPVSIFDPLAGEVQTKEKMKS